VEGRDIISDTKKGAIESRKILAEVLLESIEGSGVPPSYNAQLTDNIAWKYLGLLRGTEIHQEIITISQRNIFRQKPTRIIGRGPLYILSQLLRKHL
jgi:hypothetical protein